MYNNETIFQAFLLIRILRQLLAKMAAPMHDDNFDKIVQSNDKKLKLKQREALVYLGLWKGDLIVSRGDGRTTF